MPLPTTDEKEGNAGGSKGDGPARTGILSLLDLTSGPGRSEFPVQAPFRDRVHGVIAFEAYRTTCGSRFVYPVGEVQLHGLV